MKKMNVTFKSMLGFVFVLALMLGTTNINAQSELTGLPDISGVTGTKDLSTVNAFSFTGVTFLGTNEAKFVLTDAFNQLDNDFNGDDIQQNRAFVKGTFYRNIIKGIDQTGNVGDAIIGAYNRLVYDADNNPFSDFISAQSTFEDTVEMLSN